MIVSNLKTWKQEKEIYSQGLQKALGFLENTDWSTMEPGTYEVEGKRIYAMLMEKETDILENRFPEAHKKYIDIQCMLQGAEKIGCSRLEEGLVIKEDLLEERDLVFFEKATEKEFFISLFPDDFAVFFPEDVHRPLCIQGEKQVVRKVVMKIAVE